MLLQNPFFLGLILAIVGLVFWLVARLAFNPPATAKTALLQTPEEPEQQQDAVLLVKEGGLAVWANALARDLFDLKEGEAPHLEKMARHVRPEDDFLRLCAADGQARLILDNTALDANAYSLHLNGSSHRVVTLRRAHLGLELADARSKGGGLQALSQLMHDYSASLDLEQTLRAVYKSIERLLPADTIEICLWDERQEGLLPYRLTVGQDGEKAFELRQGLYRLGEGSAGRLAQARQTLLLQDVAEIKDLTNPPGQLRIKIHGYLGVPLMVGEDLVGTLELGSFTRGTFGQADLDLLTLIASQAAVALRNALLHRHEQRRAAELNGLTQLTQAFASIRDPRGLYKQLVNSLAPLVHVRILGFLIYNENTRMLEGRAPFYGLPVEFIEIYRVPIPTGSRLEEAFLGQECIQSQNAATDPRWFELGLTPIAAAASLHDTVLIPLVSGGRMLGYLQASNHLDASPEFSQDELHLLTIIASQVAPIIENAGLLQQLTLRAQRAEALRRIGSLASTNAPLDDILKYALEEIAQLLEADFAAVFMVDRERTVLKLHRSSCFGRWDDINEQLSRLPVEDAQYPFTAAGSLRTIYSGKVLPEKPLVPFYRRVMNALNLESLAASPLVISDEGVAEIWMCSRKADYFDTGDLNVITAAAGQLAGVVERALEDRSEELNREHHRLQTMLRVSNELSASLDIQQVLQRSLVVINEAIGSQESLILTAPESGLFRAGERLARIRENGTLDETSLERQIDLWVTRKRSPAIVENLSEDLRWTLPAEKKHLASSLLGIPLILGEEVLGSLLLLHAQPGFFQAEQVELLEAVARQIASTLKNTELFNLIRDQSEKLGGMLRGQQIEASRSRAILEAVADGVVVTDAERRITLLNASAGRILDIDPDKLAGQPFEQLEALVGEAGEEWLGTIRGWSLEQAGVHEGQTYAGQVNLDNQRVVAIHLAPVFWRASFLGTVSIFRDITHQVQVDKLKSEFIANVSHELRTPLTSIKGYVDIMLMGATGELSEQQKHFLNVVRENSLRLQGLVDDLLDVSRIQAGRIVLNYEPVDLGEMANLVAAEMRELSRSEQKTINFKVVVDPGLLPVRADRERTHQVLRSLALNGFNYTPENGVVTIRVHKAEEGGLQVDVQDDGIGIPFEDQPRIFERFFRGEHPLVMATAGAGLGLALAKILIEMQDGRIWFESSGLAGEGSVFSFVLPVHSIQS